MSEFNLKELQAPLSVSEVEFRIQSINKGGYATILAYKDARVDMNRLNKFCGVGFWQRKHEVIGTKEFCSVGIWNNDIKEWCWVQDTGSKSNTEAEKGQSSDAFKRACFNLGIGIELYDYPLISIKLKGGKDHRDEWYLNDKKKDRFGGPSPQAGYGLKLKEWVWHTIFNESGVLIYLAAKDQNGELRFAYDKREKVKKAA